MKLILVGMNYKTAPVELRERLQNYCSDQDVALPDLMMNPEIKEAICLATCNRIEVIARLGDTARGEDFLKNFMCRQGNFDIKETEKYLYIYRDIDAVLHLFRVASSLDSMVMGEPQILGQIKDAYRMAVDRHATGVLLNRLTHHAFQVAKRVRSETEIAGNAVSVSYAAVELAKKIFGSLKGKSALLIGAGEMSELAARHLIRQGVGNIFIANRTIARAQQMAEEFHGVAVSFDEFPSFLPEVDIVIASTGAPGYILTAPMVAAALKKHKHKQHMLFLIDIAVPRDIEPEVGELDNVYLYNIDHLQDVVDANRAMRRGEALRAEELIAEEVAGFEKWFNSLAAVPAIVRLREKTDSIVQGELDRFSAWLGGLKEEDRAHVEWLVSSVVNKILHDPITVLKEESSEGEELPDMAAIRRLFKL
ncbi:MAG: glutamyl-tRNA reductase [Syntrophales bacterium]|jgi:glutamyl-tRNA reductase|nr:glutamyl-tRNA reductase [Syntrophales bacterium]